MWVRRSAWIALVIADLCAVGGLVVLAVLVHQGIFRWAAIGAAAVLATLSLICAVMLFRPPRAARIILGSPSRDIERSWPRQIDSSRADDRWNDVEAAGPGGAGSTGPLRGPVLMPPDWRGRPTPGRFSVEPDTSGEPKDTRSVNTRLVVAGSDEDLPRDGVLQREKHYELLVDIGPFHRRSLLRKDEGRWPGELLPDDELRLRAVLQMDGQPTPEVARLTLPRGGESYSCDCTRDVHESDCTRHQWARLPLPALPEADGNWHGELLIYFQVVVVHAQHLTLPAGRPAAGGPRSEVTFRLTRNFSDLGRLSGRVASVHSNRDGTRAVVNDIDFADNPVALAPGGASDACRSARELLYTLHLRDTPDGPVSLLDSKFGKTPAQFVADLTALARHGRMIYRAVFADRPVSSTLPLLIRYEAQARRRPVVLTFTTSVGDELCTPTPIPWALMYDLPIAQDDSQPVEVCPSLDRFGGQTASPVDIPPHCPEHHDGSTDVLCPFGFWGLSSVLEQPASTGSIAWYVYNKAVEPISIIAATDPRLDKDITEQHFKDLREQLGSCAPENQPISSRDQLCTMLAQEDIDLVYLYCHGRYKDLPGTGRAQTVLGFGESYVHSADIEDWADWRWPESHWARHRPLVVINGCHTTALTDVSLSNLVHAFVEYAGGAGVIGTEITVEQGMSSWVGALLLRSLLQGGSVGAAMRQARWQMISSRNALGFAYTMYCLSDLRLRPKTDPAEAEEISTQ
jgi:hypothetical protein